MKTTPMSRDPKVEKATEEMEAILKKYDCAGMFVVYRPGHMEDRINPVASWSAATMEGKGVTFKPLLVTPENTAEKRLKIITDTLTMLVNIRMKITQYAMALTKAEFTLRGYYKLQPKKP